MFINKTLGKANPSLQKIFETMYAGWLDDNEILERALMQYFTRRLVSVRNT